MAGDVIRQLVHEVRGLETAVMAASRGGTEIGRDIETVPICRGDGTTSFGSRGPSLSGTDSPVQSKGRLDLAASMAMTDAMLGRLQSDKR